LGHYREDYEFVAHPGVPDYLDEHNGRFCVTPEYPNGIYAYFCTVDENWNSAYPYVVGPTFYGVKSASKVTTIAETVSTYNPTVGMNEQKEEGEMMVKFDAALDLLAIQYKGMLKENMEVCLWDTKGALMAKKWMPAGSTILYFDAATLVNGQYIVAASKNSIAKASRVMVLH
jgi:hypothetical protein